MQLGKIVKSNSHIDYICQIYNPYEVPQAPNSEDYAFGTFIRMDLGDQRQLVGVVYDTVLFNPDFGRQGPRLSPETELAIFSPDYLGERAVLVGILTIGMIYSNGRITQGVPLLAATADVIVERIDEDAIRSFHQGNPSLKIGYSSLLLSHSSPLAIHLLQTITRRLAEIFPDQVDLLSVLSSDLEWKSQIAPMGGVR